MTTHPEIAVTLTKDLYRHLQAESRRLNVPLEWLVAAMVVDSIDEAQGVPFDAPFAIPA